MGNYGASLLSARSGVGGTTIAYDTEGRVTSYSHDMGGTSGDVTTGFGYNPANQVTARTRNNDAYVGSGTRKPR